MYTWYLLVLYILVYTGISWSFFFLQEKETSKEKLEVIGFDENTHMKNLNSVETKVNLSLSLSLSRFLSLCSLLNHLLRLWDYSCYPPWFQPTASSTFIPDAPNTQKSYEALAAVESLQNQLL